MRQCILCLRRPSRTAHRTTSQPPQSIPAPHPHLLHSGLFGPHAQAPQHLLAQISAFSDVNKRLFCVAVSMLNTNTCVVFVVEFVLVLLSLLFHVRHPSIPIRGTTKSTTLVIPLFLVWSIIFLHFHPSCHPLLNRLMMENSVADYRAITLITAIITKLPHSCLK